ncbi:MAG: FixH family protein [Candidatus Syntrophosphaera sp.]|nr:FixH family protein [Candidatus Syntrophosphaera sp.]
MNKALMIILASLVLLPLVAQHCGSCPAGLQAEAKSTYTASDAPVLSTKKATPLYDNKSVTYKWDKSPKIGTHILYVTVRDKKNRPSDDFTITANAYMPSMRGAHDTGPKAMRMNKQKQYAIPVNFMMLGDWEIELQFSKDGKVRNTALVKLEI